ncbi:APH(3') family aminoglycoside O-phosphotransferase [Roseateles chitinivorans]|uniref:APH(3') family aminoglycoside O-phosphotransferase n=1 Tax=Roseateles chitinivorans TaxID=2917965 RepID=UPI003D67BE53
MPGAGALNGESAPPADTHPGLHASPRFMTDHDESDAPREIPARAPELPSTLAARLAGYDWHRNLVGEAGATVYRLHRSGAPTLYLKVGDGDAADAIVDEFARLRWFADRWPTPRIEHFEWADGSAWLLTRALPGRTAYEWLADEPGRAAAIVTSLGRFLGDLHKLPVNTCPFHANHRLQLDVARERLAAGLIDADDFDEARQGWTPQQVWAAINAMLPFTEDPVVSHGDFSLDNILMNEDGDVVGVIDLGRAGIADRYRDLAILANCLDELDPALRDTLFSAYGIAEPDARKLDFHLLLDECF